MRERFYFCDTISAYMRIDMDFQHMQSIEDVRSFIKGSERIVLKAVTIEDKYEVISEMIHRFNYLSLDRKEKRVIFIALKLFTGYKRSQLHHLVERALLGQLSQKPYHRKNAYHKYSTYDIGLLEKTDELHYRMSGAATHEILRREYEVFHHKRYENVSHVSVSHINNLRSEERYKAKYLSHTQARLIPIGETAKPETNGNPGSIRVDTVHQSDVYHINSVDEITQWEIAICVPHISEAYLYPVLKLLLAQYPFHIFNFHSDRGAEFINKIVAQLLNKLLIHQTKSRSKHCNDNALIEGKNGSVIRKNLGYFHINQGLSGEYNDFFTEWFNPYLNYHRPCGYVTETTTDYKGREKKIYGEYTTPYEKLKSISQEKKISFLKPNFTFAEMDKIAYNMSDNEYASLMRKQQYKLFDINNLLKSTVV